MAKDERMDSLELALKNEANERKFYLDHAQRTDNALGKEMFLEIADDELEHFQRLKELHTAWAEKGKWPETVPLKVKETKVRALIGQHAKKPAPSPASNADDLKAVQIAIEFEANGASFYASLRDRSTDQKERDFFNLLADIEHEHYISLRDVEEYLKDPEGWFRRTERHTLDGA